MGMKLTPILSIAVMSDSGLMRFMHVSWVVPLQPKAETRLSQLVLSLEELVSDRGPKDVWPLDKMPARKGGLEPKALMCMSTEREPADSPQMVTLDGSPPKE